MNDLPDEPPAPPGHPSFGDGPDPDLPISAVFPSDEPKPVARALVVLAILLPFLVVVLTFALVLTRDEGGSAQAATPGTASVEQLAGGGSYALWARNEDGTAVRWNGCEPIRWVLNPAGAPLGAAELLGEAMERVTEASGIAFEYLGETSEVPTRDRAPWQPEAYDRDRWAPVLFAWQSPTLTDVPLTELDRAVAIPVAVGTSEVRNFVTAQVVFNRDSTATPGFGNRRNSIGITMLHELLHVVGLQHVDDPGEMMFPFPTSGVPGFGDGDRAGLVEVGTSQPCQPTPEPREVEVEYR